MQQNKSLLISAMIFLLLGCLFVNAGSEVPSTPATTTTVILIRHAERDNFFNITAQGRERAKALVDAVSDMSIPYSKRIHNKASKQQVADKAETFAVIVKNLKAVS